MGLVRAAFIVLSLWSSCKKVSWYTNSCQDLPVYKTQWAPSAQSLTCSSRCLVWLSRCGAHCGERFTSRSDTDNQRLHDRDFVFYIREMASIYCLTDSTSFFFINLSYCPVLLFYFENLGKLAAFALFKVLVSWQKKKLSDNIRNNIPFTNQTRQRGASSWGCFLSDCMVMLYVLHIDSETCWS